MFQFISWISQDADLRIMFCFIFRLLFPGILLLGSLILVLPICFLVYRIFTLSFSMALFSLWLYHLTSPINLVFWHKPRCTILASISWGSWNSFWASFLELSIRWAIDSSLSPQSLYFSHISWPSMFFFIHLVPRAWSCAATIKHSVFFFRNPSFIHRHDSVLVAPSASVRNLPTAFLSSDYVVLPAFFPSLLRFFVSSSEMLWVAALLFFSSSSTFGRNLIFYGILLAASFIFIFIHFENIYLTCY